MNMPRFRLLARYILILALAFLPACNGDYTTALPHNYFIARVYAGAFAIVNPRNRVVTQVSRRAIAVAVVGDIVAGEIDPNDEVNRSSNRKRFFVINTRTDQCWVQLSSREYAETLQRQGVASPPALVRVSRFSKLFTLRTAV